MSTDLDHINLDYLEAIADGSKEIINELIEIFLDQVPEFTDGLSEGFQSKNWNEIAALAHKAKSSVVSMGMKTLGEVHLKNLELLAKNRRIKEIEGQYAELPPEIESEIINLKQNLESYTPEKIQWVMENDQDETIKKIIDTFVANCEQANKELTAIIEN